MSIFMVPDIDDILLSKLDVMKDYHEARRINHYYKTLIDMNKLYHYFKMHVVMVIHFVNT
jgi:hypothetical protein